MIIWIERALALAIHDRQLAEHGGQSGVRDEALLESALARPRQAHAHVVPAPDLADLAASLAHGVARNHPFVDGNEQTAHVCYRTFLLLNGANLVANDEQKYARMLGLVDGSITEAEFAAWLRQHLQIDTPPDAVQERGTGYVVP